MSVWKGFSAQELRVLRRLATPEKIQTYLETIRYNNERSGATCRSPLHVLRRGEAHCIEGALFAAACMRLAGKKPLIVDFEANGDFDHVVCVFKRKGLWGAISKSNFHSLGYRDPIFKSLRELALSYFPSYHNYRGQKSLRRVSVPVSVTQFDSIHWMTSDDDLWDIGNYLFTVKHEELLPKSMTQRDLRVVPRAAQYADTAKPPSGWKNGKPKKGH